MFVVCARICTSILSQHCLVLDRHPEAGCGRRVMYDLAMPSAGPTMLAKRTQPPLSVCLGPRNLTLFSICRRPACWHPPPSRRALPHADVHTHHAGCLIHLVPCVPGPLQPTCHTTIPPPHLLYHSYHNEWSLLLPPSWGSSCASQTVTSHQAAVHGAACWRSTHASTSLCLSCGVSLGGL